MAKKPKQPSNFFDELLAKAPDFGFPPATSYQQELLQQQKLAMQKAFGVPAPTSTTQSGSSLTMNNLQNALAALQSQKNQNQLNSQGKRGAMASTASTNLASYYAQHYANQLGQLGGTPPRNNKPMQPNKFQINDRVTVRTGRTEFMVIRFESTGYSGSSAYVYYLQDQQGRQTREVEGDLKMVGGYSGDGPKTQVTFDTVIMADEKRQQILEALEQIHQYKLIFEQWGFGETIEKGRGVSMLFYGPPGTGKTLVCQAIAHKLGKKLAVISTADIESSAPGEAERNIRKVFEEAKKNGTIILFDECDSLIYTRQNVGPILSAQINELLSQIERFEGLTLFTTNRLGTLDEAVNRRLALKLELALPSFDERIQIWKRMFPEKCPLGKIDWDRLAGIEVSGGYIKNSVLRAARMAATEKIPDADKKIKMNHLIKALALETKSMIDFEAARDEHRSGIGVGNANGTISTVGRGRGVDIKKVMADEVGK